MNTINTLQKTLAQQHIQLTIIQNPQTIGYLTGFYCQPHERLLLLCLFPDKEPVLLVPALDVEHAKQSVTNMTIIPHYDHDNVWQMLQTLFTPYQSAIIGIEKNYVTMQTLDHLRLLLPNILQAVDVTPAIRQLQLIKQPHEIQAMKYAGKTADLAIQIAARALANGKTEVDIVAEIEYHLKKQNVPSMSFDTMVLTQQNAANPHGIPSQLPIAENQLVLLDLGTMHNGYASDITRTLLFGDTPTPEQQTIFDIVIEAHHTAMAKAKIGMSAHELDAIARDIITKYGYGDYFTHRLGHGIGQSVHEFPSIAKGNDFILQENMCFSIEPGIYIPNRIGVRIEDCVYLTPNGAVPLTHSPYDLSYRAYIA